MTVMIQKPLTGMFRMQLGEVAQLDLSQAADVMADYIRHLLGNNRQSNGRVALYLPPIQESPADSQHYYNGLDPNKVATNLGGADAFAYMAKKLRRLGVERILDIVPNHGNVSWDALQSFKNNQPDVESGNVFWDSSARELVFDLDPVTRWVRRFFDVDTLAGYRVDDPVVFEYVHNMVLDMVKAGDITGVRIDHPDGLREPTSYLQRLYARLKEVSGREVPVWVEKVVVGSEKLSADWPVAGDVGYGWMQTSGKMWVPATAAATITPAYATAAQDSRSYDDILLEARRQTAHNRECGQAAEVDFLCEVLQGDQTISREAIEQSLAALPVYRTYMNVDEQSIPAASRALIDEAVATGALDARIASILLGESEGDDATLARHRKFAAYWQHFTGPNMAISAENTAFFRYPRNIGANEVGGEPGHLSASFAEMHALNQHHQQNLPSTGLAKATHDGKLGWFTRNLILAMLEHGDEYTNSVWPMVQDNYLHLLADGNDDGRSGRTLWQLLQVVVGAGLGVAPIEFNRVEQYLQKALCEAKKETHWCHRNQEWEARVIACARAMYEGTADGSVAPLTDDNNFMSFVARVHKTARRNSKRQMLLMMTAPGVPMFYQGDEVWEPYFVDPDNRRPQDWEARKQMLARVLSGESNDELDMMVLIHKVMTFRNSNPEFFGADSVYSALDEGDGVFAFSRSIDGKRIRIACGAKLEGGVDVLAGFDDLSLSIEL